MNLSAFASLRVYFAKKVEQSEGGGKQRRGRKTNLRVLLSSRAQDLQLLLRDWTLPIPQESPRSRRREIRLGDVLELVLEGFHELVPKQREGQSRSSSSFVRADDSTTSSILHLRNATHHSSSFARIEECLMRRAADLTVQEGGRGVGS